MSNVAQINTLLQNIIGVMVKYEPIHREHRFNIFSILRHGREEVALHSRFIAELLNPEGKHGHGDEFLKLFLRLIDDVESEQIEDLDSGASVRIERPFQIENAAGRIDILIRTPSLIVVIENKVYASDQDRQLDRYFRFAKEEAENSPELKPVVCYLTLWGDAPDKSTWSEASESSALRVLSYGDIRDWLDKCLGRAALEPALRETISQYQHLIDKLRGETMANDEKNEVVTAIRRNEESVRAAKAIHRAWRDALAEGILEYWQDLEARSEVLFGNRKLQQEVLPSEVINRFKYSWSQIKDMVNSKRGDRRNNHGLIIPIGTYDKAVVCLSIRAVVAPQQGMIFGIRMVEVHSNGTFEYTVNKEPRYDDLAEQITPKGFTRTKHWLAYRSLENVPDLTTPEAKEVADLMLQDPRKKAVNATIKQVKELHEYVKNHLPKGESGSS